MNQPLPVTLITGAGSGIGRALAKALAAEGYAIAAIDRREDGLRSLVDELQSAGRSIAVAIADVTDPTALAQSVSDLEARLGPIDLAIANAGIGLETSGLFYSTSAMNQVFAVNLLGVSNTIGAVLPGMVQRRRGHLVAISSVASYRGLPRMLAYSASKAGVNAIMDGLRVELKPLDIAVTTICPGWVRTPLTAPIQGKLDFLMEVDDAAREIVWAIRKKKAFHAFPRRMRWQLALLGLLPRSMQDWWLTKKMKRVRLS